jgi:hypothetical protein
MPQPQLTRKSGRLYSRSQAVSMYERFHANCRKRQAPLANGVRIAKLRDIIKRFSFVVDLDEERGEMDNDWQKCLPSLKQQNYDRSASISTDRDLLDQNCKTTMKTRTCRGILLPVLATFESMFHRE